MLCARGISRAGALFVHLPAVALSARRFSSDSHPDFAPVKKAAPTSPSMSVADVIKRDIAQHLVMVYMKGHPIQPACGFSAQVVKIFEKEGLVRFLLSICLLLQRQHE